MSSRLVQTTVVPTDTVSVCGPKLKLSIFTSAFAADGWSFAVTLGDPASSSIAIMTGTAKPAIHTFFVVIVLFPLSSFIFLLDLHLSGPDLYRSTQRPGQLRSEERRVGKECRSRWS